MTESKKVITKVAVDKRAKLITALRKHCGGGEYYWQVRGLEDGSVEEISAECDPLEALGFRMFCLGFLEALEE